MSLPSLNQYSEAVQNPRTAFSDGQLKTGRVQVNGLGLPLALSGGFALTYNLTCQDGRQYAVRCFHKQTHHLEERYQYISAHLKQTRSAHLVDFEYQREGVRVRNEWFPIVKMEWVKGKPLGTFMERSYSDTRLVTRLRERFAQLAGDLPRQGIAHGDLQNGNVMVDGDALRLIDYDGMYVTRMPPGSGAELGHKHFQHPRRAVSDFGPDIDRFSFIVIDVSLQALTVVPKLFEKYSNGENILFTANDFSEPQQSPLFQALLGQPQLKTTAERFAAVCVGDIHDVPTLDEFRRGIGVPSVMPAVVAVSPGKLRRLRYNGALPVVSADDFLQVERNIGNRLEIIGRITKVHRDSTLADKPYVFVNFGDWRDNIVKINIWSEGLEQLTTKPDDSWVGKWVSVTGLVDPPYTSPRFGHTHLSITVTEQSQLHLIPKEEAEYRLGIDSAESGKAPERPASKPKPALVESSPPGDKPAPHPCPSPTAVATGPSPAAQRNQEILERLQRSRDVGASDPTTQSSGQIPKSQPASQSGTGACLPNARLLHPAAQPQVSSRIHGPQRTLKTTVGNKQRMAMWPLAVATAVLIILCGIATLPSLYQPSPDNSSGWDDTSEATVQRTVRASAASEANEAAPRSAPESEEEREETSEQAAHSAPADDIDDYRETMSTNRGQPRPEELPTFRRLWTDSSGRTFVATLDGVASRGESVRLRNEEDGKRHNIPTYLLSQADQQYVRALDLNEANSSR